MVAGFVESTGGSTGADRPRYADAGRHLRLNDANSIDRGVPLAGRWNADEQLRNPKLFQRCAALATCGRRFHERNRHGRFAGRQRRHRACRTAVSTGNTMIVDHGAGLFPCSPTSPQFRVAKGDAVAPDTIVGLVGATGRGDRPPSSLECPSEQGPRRSALAGRSNTVAVAHSSPAYSCLA